MDCHADVVMGLFRSYMLCRNAMQQLQSTGKVSSPHIPSQRSTNKFHSSSIKMKSTLFVFVLTLCSGHAFQFMKGWKMPTYDPNQEIVQERFGDKST
jgi:hypothetical protein